MSGLLHSEYRALCKVTLPYRGRQRYMHSFDIAAPEMPEGYEDYLVPVTKLLRAAEIASGQAHMTVDEKIVAAGLSQRRPDPHVDGCFIPPIGSWAHRNMNPHMYESDPDEIYKIGGGGWSHSGSGGWLHECNNVPGEHVARMPVIVAASVPGCRAWRGTFCGTPRSDGDLSHIADQLGAGEVLKAGVGYLLSPDCVHESMRMNEPSARTFLRIALPVGSWSPSGSSRRGD